MLLDIIIIIITAIVKEDFSIYILSGDIKTYSLITISQILGITSYLTQ